MQALPHHPAPVELLKYGATLKGVPSGAEKVPHKEWIGNREEISEQDSGVGPGHGNQIYKKEKEGSE